MTPFFKKSKHAMEIAAFRRTLLLLHFFFLQRFLGTVEYFVETSFLKQEAMMFFFPQCDSFITDKNSSLHWQIFFQFNLFNLIYVQFSHVFFKYIYIIICF
jgi:hypothetical protein